jgi:hypothetical protein
MLQASLMRLEPADWIANAVVVCVTVGLGVVFTRPRVRGSTSWRATVTPLASIIGSGFLVIAPLLGFTVGPWSLLAMAGIVGLSYAVGEAIRYNIAHVEKISEASGSADGIDATLQTMERGAKLALAVAYVIAVTFYLELLGAFVLRPFGAQGDVTGQKIVATLLLVTIAGFGAWRGLHMLESLEAYAVELKLSIIGGLLAAMLFQNGLLVAEGGWRLPAVSTSWSVDTVRKLLGAFLIAQGFETSRYLRGAYPAELRIRTMRYAQRVAASIYLLFVALATVDLGLFQSITETGIIDLSSRIAASLPILLVVGAVGSQFSAAVADTIGSGGLVEEATRGRIPARVTYAVVGALSLTLLWSADIFAVIAYASRAFALYYAVQCVMAGIHACRRRPGSPWRAGAFILLAIVMLATAAFGVPAESR